MKKYTLSLLVVLVVSALLFYFSANMKRASPFESVIAHDNQELSQYRAQESNKLKEQYAALSDSQKNEVVQYQSRIKAIMADKNQEVKFFGRIIDQNNNGVSGVSIESHKTYYSGIITPDLSLQKKQFTVFTNSKGIFEINSGKTVNLTIDKIYKEGYYFHHNGLIDFHYADSSQDYIHQYDSAEHAYVIKIWKLRPQDHIENIHQYFDGSWLNLDGSPVKTRLAGLTGMYSMTINFSANSSSEYPHDFTITIASDNAKMKLADSDDMMMAPPISGYAKTINKRYTPKLNNGYPNFVMKFYVKDNSKWGSVEMDFHVYPKDVSTIFHIRVGLEPQS
jgi:hypothetical protein